MDYAYNNGNFKYTPGTYIMAAKGCWHGQCTFCVEKGSHYQIRSTESVIDEIGECIKLGYKEIFDDSGTFPTGAWCLRFCQAMIAKGYNKQVRLGCNMRLDYIHPNLKGMQLMRQAGFRMVLYGLESANQATLDRIHKGINITSAITRIKVCAKAGLEPHIAVMFGYPWENDKDAIATLRLVHYLLKHGYAKTAQASFYDPICDRIDTHPEDYGSNLSQKKYVKQIYNVAYSPVFWFNKIKDIKNAYDLKYLWRSIKKGVGL